MLPALLRRHVFASAVAAVAVIPSLASAAQPQDYPAGQGYPSSGQGYPPAGQGYSQPPQYAAPGGYGYDQPPPSYDQPPPGYDGSQPPPPPPGYRPDPQYDARPEDDRRYEAYAEDWAQRSCVKSRGDAGTGAVIGGLLGALLGSGFAGRHDRGTGAIVGGVAGAAGGAAIGSASGGATSPGCPPGFVLRGGAPAFYYDAGPYDYAAPGWYRPWVFYGGRWTYRPYPYHVWYYRTYGYGRPYGRPYRGRRYRPY